MLYSVLLSDLTVGTVTVSWTASTANNSPITAYLVAYSSSTTAVAPVVGIYTTTDGATTTTDITGLTVSAEYTFTVTAVNAIGSSAIGASVPAQLTIQPSISGITATAGTPSTITIAWAAPTDMTVEQYQIQSSVDSGVTFVDITAPALTTATSIIATVLAERTAYRFRVRAVNPSGKLLYYVHILTQIDVLCAQDKHIQPDV
jgi:large repetitive protein